MNANTLQLLAVLNLAVSLVLPLVHSWVTNINASEPVKVLVTALFSAVTGFITPFISGTQSWTNFDWKLALLSIASVFFATVLSHYGLWKPLTVTGSDGSIQAKFSGGIGAPSTDISSVGYEITPPVAQPAHVDTPVPASVPQPVLGDVAPVDPLPADPAGAPAAAPVDPSVGADVTPPVPQS